MPPPASPLCPPAVPRGARVFPSFCCGDSVPGIHILSSSYRSQTRYDAMCCDAATRSAPPPRPLLPRGASRRRLACAARIQQARHPFIRASRPGPPCPRHRSRLVRKPPSHTPLEIEDTTHIAHWRSMTPAHGLCTAPTITFSRPTMPSSCTTTCIARPPRPPSDHHPTTSILHHSHRIGPRAPAPFSTDHARKTTTSTPHDKLYERRIGHLHILFPFFFPSVILLLLGVLLVSRARLPVSPSWCLLSLAVDPSGRTRILSPSTVAVPDVPSIVWVAVLFCAPSNTPALRHVPV